MIDLFPEGFEEAAARSGIELAAYTDAEGRGCGVRSASSPRPDDVEDDWADRWRRFHRPVRVGALWIGPPWETPSADAIGGRHRPGPGVRNRCPRDDPVVPGAPRGGRA